MPYTYVMKIENGTAIGLPRPRPATVALESGHSVGCAHWSDEDLATIAGLGPVQPWDDTTHRPVGGGIIVDGVIVPNLEPQPAAVLAERRRAEVVARLAALDIASARPLRAIIAGTATPDDQSRLEAIETEASALRAELAALAKTTAIEPA